MTFEFQFQKVHNLDCPSIPALAGPALGGAAGAAAGDGGGVRGAHRRGGGADDRVHGRARAVTPSPAAHAIFRRREKACFIFCY